ncbi:MAG TPA: sugar transferase [Waterburya sp.]|jgi:anti-anti-sigma factor
MADPVSETGFEVDFLDDTAVMQIPVRLAGVEAVAFKEACQQLLQKSPLPEKIVFDFSKTTFIDSSGIGALVSNHKSVRLKEVKLVLRGVLPQVIAVLEMTALDKILTIEPLDQPQAPNRARAELPTTHPSVRSKVKRLLDIVGSLVGLVITAFLLIPIALAIKLNSPGPIFFGQTRLGWMGKPFTIWKFRSMYIDAEERKKELLALNQADGKIFKMDNDPRITPVGRVLRKTSLDELPQFWNVLKGEMSLVGTRPPTPNEVDIYEVPEWQRLDVKPGMTGEWQVNGRSSIRNFEDIIKLDLRYQRNWNLAYDLKLIVKTIVVVFRKDSGAV